MVVLSLIASVIIGVVTNVDSHTVNKDVEEYVADITGGFTAEKEQAYTDYNPSKNYSGYTTSNPIPNEFPIIFTPSNYTNNYPISHSSQKVSTNFTKYSDFAAAQTMVWAHYPGNNTEWWNYIENNLRYDEFIDGPRIFPATGDSAYTKDLSAVLTECVTDGTTELGSTPDFLRMTINSTVRATYVSTAFIPDFALSQSFSTYVYNLSNPVIITDKSTVLSADNRPAYDTYDDVYPYDLNTLRSIGAGNTFTITLEYDVSHNNIILYANGTQYYTGSPDNKVILFGNQYMLLQAGGWAPGTPNQTSIYALPTSSQNLSVEYFADTTVNYIDTRYGIGIRDVGTTTWTNDQQNGLTSIAFSTWASGDPITFDDSGADYSNTAVISYYNSAATDTFTVSRQAGRTYVSLNGGPNVDIGTWKQIQVDLNNIDGKLTVYPIGTWDNFNNYTLYGTSIDIGSLNKANLKSIAWTTTGTTLRLEVENTRVFFNNYGVVMIDPYITISNLWPNYTWFTVHITDVASIGSAITIGSTTYPVTDGMITVNGEQFSVTELSLEYSKTSDAPSESWEVVIKTSKASTTVDATSTYLGFTGPWYFAAGFYKIVQKEVTEWEWNPIYDWGASHIFLWMAGILLVLGIGAYKLGYVDGLSAIILITAEVILFIVGGTI